MGHRGRVLTVVELQGGLFNEMTFHSETGMLPEVCSPVFHQKNFVDHPGPHQIALQSPAESYVGKSGCVGVRSPDHGLARR